MMSHLETRITAAFFDEIAELDRLAAEWGLPILDQWEYEFRGGAPADPSPPYPSLVAVIPTMNGWWLR